MTKSKATKTDKPIQVEGEKNCDVAHPARKALFKEIAIRRINTTKCTMRPQDATEKNAAEIGPSIEPTGPIQPITVGELEGEYYLIDGFSRLLSVKNRGGEEIEAKVIPIEKESDLLKYQAIANTCRTAVDGCSEARFLARTRDVLSQEIGHKLTYPEFLKRMGLSKHYTPNDLSKLLRITEFDQSLDPILQKIGSKRPSYLPELGRIENKDQLKPGDLKNLLQRIELDSDGEDKVTASMLKEAITRLNDGQPWQLVTSTIPTSFVDSTSTQSAEDPETKPTDTMPTSTTAKKLSKATSSLSMGRQRKKSAQPVVEEDASSTPSEVPAKPPKQEIHGVDRLNQIYGRWDGEDLLSVKLSHHLGTDPKIESSEDWKRVLKIGEMITQVALYKIDCIIKNIAEAPTDPKGRPQPAGEISPTDEDVIKSKMEQTEQDKQLSEAFTVAVNARLNEVVGDVQAA